MATGRGVSPLQEPLGLGQHGADLGGRVVLKQLHVVRKVAGQELIPHQAVGKRTCIYGGENTMRVDPPTAPNV